VALSCPDCATALKPYRLEDISLDICDSCGGVWMDRGEIGKIRRVNAGEIKEFEHKIEPAPHRLERRAHDPKCPKCAGPLHPFNYAGGKLQLETCDGLCGVWAENRELEEIANLENIPPDALRVAHDYEMESQAFVGRMNSATTLLRILDYRRGWPFFWPVPQSW
jgi:Zn-finger nucleic acid-binding protein